MEINEYVRADISVIAKVIDICKDGSYELDIEFETDYIVYDFNITKHSKDIIDLIEVGDYVNGREVTSFGYDYNDKIIYVNTISCLSFENDEIKSVLTKEQFEANVYTIEKER